MFSVFIVQVFIWNLVNNLLGTSRFLFSLESIYINAGGLIFGIIYIVTVVYFDFFKSRGIKILKK